MIVYCLCQYRIYANIDTVRIKHGFHVLTADKQFNKYLLKYKETEVINMGDKSPRKEEKKKKKTDVKPVVAKPAPMPEPELVKKVRKEK